MSDALFDTQAGGITGAAGQALFGFDSTNKGLFWTKNEAGLYTARSKNASIASVTFVSGDTYLTDSDLLIPSWGFQARTIFKWQISASKTAAGTAQPLYAVRIGANRTTADTARMVWTGPAQTAIADIGTLNIIVVVRSIGASGVMQGTAWWDHRGTAVSSTIGTGFANDGTGHVELTAAGFDMTAIAGLYAGLSMNVGASGSWTITQVQAEVDW